MLYTNYIHITHLQELLLDGSQQVKTGLDLCLRVRRLHRCCHHRHKPTFACHLEENHCITKSYARIWFQNQESWKTHLCCVGNHGNVDVRIPSDLLLWDDDLGGE